MRVLIVDDSKLLRVRLAEMVEMLPGAEVVGRAKDFDEAVELIKRMKPQIVILDIKMPGRNGIDVLRIIKNKYPHMVTIMFTNYSEDEYRQKCQDIGADFFFDKTTEFQSVEDVLRELIAGDCKRDNQGFRLVKYS